MKGKNVVVTGGSKGIGLMLAAGFVQQGCNVFIFSRKTDQAAADALNKVGPGKCTALSCDVVDEAAVVAVAASVKAACPNGIHVLVNNSGATWGESIETTKRESFDKIMNVNVNSLFFITQAFLPMLEQTAVHGDPARVINIASIDGHQVPQLETYAYAASKAGVIHLNNVLAGNLSPRNITCNCISPGLFPSKMGNQVLKFGGEDVIKYGIPLGRMGAPKDIFSAALFFAGPGGAFTTGADIVIDGGVCAKPRM